MTTSNLKNTIDMQTIFSGWRTVVLTTFAAILIGAALLLTIKPMQQVSAKLIVQPKSVNIDGKSATREKEFLPTQAEVLRSPAVITRAIREINPKLSELAVVGEVGRIAENLKVDPLAGTSILQVRYTDAGSQAAAEVVTALVIGYEGHLAATGQQQHREMLVALTNRDLELQRSLSTLQSQYSQLKRKHADSAGADPIASGRILAGLEDNLASFQNRRLFLERSARRLTATTTPPNSQLVLDELAALSNEGWSEIPNPTLVQTRMEDAKSLVSELSVTHGPQHPELLAAKSVLARHGDELTRLVESAPAVIQRTLDGILAQEKALQQRYDQQIRDARELEVMRLTETQKQTEIDRVKQSYDTIHAQLQQRQLADDATAGGAGISVSLLEPPTPTERSFAANPLVVIGIAGLLGLLFGVSLLVVVPQVRSLMPNHNSVSAATSA